MESFHRQSFSPTAIGMLTPKAIYWSIKDASSCNCKPERSVVAKMATVAGGALVTEVGAKKLNYFAEQLFEQWPQDMTYTKRYKRRLAPVNSVALESPLQFDIQGKFTKKHSKL